MHIDHFMTFGTFAEQRYYTYPNIDTYKGVVINGNMASHAPEGLSQFLLEKTKSISYIIDPITHAFQHDVSYVTSIDKKTKAVKVKSSIEKLANIYGPPFSDIIGVKPINPSDFTTQTIKDSCKKCLDFQLTHLSKIMVESSTNKKYLDLSVTDLHPYTLIAPYFFMDETTFDKWLELQILFIQEAIKLKAEKNKLFAAIVLSIGVISDENLRTKLINSYSKLDVDGYLIWIDEFDEHSASINELKDLVEFGRALRNNKTKEVINLHGSYFSILAAGQLGDSAFTGIAHGPEYGEYRAVIPVGGGIPFAKYYIPKLHQRVKYKVAQRIFKEKGWLENIELFQDKICNCDVCKKTLENNPNNFLKFGITTPKEFVRSTGIVRIDYPISQTKEICLLHYLERKAIEYKFSATASIVQINSDLDEGIKLFEEVIGEKGVSHLKKWKTALNK